MNDRSHKQFGPAPLANRDEPDRSVRFNAEQAAAYLGLAKATLAKLRCRGGGAPYCKLGRRVVYDRRELDQWLRSKQRVSTTDVGCAVPTKPKRWG
jgi:Helix-turn-helix domain